MKGYRAFALRGWRGYVLSQAAEEIPLEALDAWSQSPDLQVVRGLPLRCIARQECPSGPAWYLKRIQGLTDRKDGFLHALKWRFRPSRALHILKISQTLEEAGFRTPKVILAARHRPWWPWGKPTDLLVTEESGGELVSNLLCRVPPLPEKERQALLQKTGRELARLHAAGFVHGDCHPGNYFLDDMEKSFLYIDNDRTCRCRSFSPAGAARNLVSAAFALSRKLPLTFYQDFTQILDAYRQEARLSPRQEASLLARILDALEKRLRNGR
ncbi:MAG: lipopolysaccharide kinase InaA family protein [Oligosphaeraceae bacterium]